MVESEYYAVNDRPVKVIEFEDGSSDIFVFDWSTGGFIPDRSYWEHIHKANAFKDVDRLTHEQFEQLVEPLRAQAVVKHTRTPIAWQRADDDDGSIQTQIAGHTLTLRTHFHATEPTYALSVDGEKIADLHDWPSVWSRPG